MIYERKIIPSYNETLRACFTVVKSNLFEISAFFLKFSKESGCLYIVSTFEKMKKLQFLKVGDYMKTVTRAKYLDRIIELSLLASFLNTTRKKLVTLDFYIFHEIK